MPEQNNRIFNKVSGLWKKFKALKRLKKIAIILPIIFVLSVGPIFWGVARETFRHVGQVFTDILDHIQLNGNDLEIEPDYLDEARRRLSAMGIETQSLGLGGNQNYLERFLEAEIVTNYPYLGGENLQGTVYFQRAKVDGSTEQLEYLSYEEFYRLKERNDMNMYHYFTVDVDDDWTVHVGQNSEAGDFDIEKINYKNMVSKYSMPFEFTIALAYISQNPQFALAVVNLVKDSHIVISIAETKIETEHHTLHSYRQMVETYNPDTDSSTIQGPYYHEQELPITTDVDFRTNVVLTSAKTWILNEIIDFQYSNPDPAESARSSTGSPNYTETSSANQVITYTDITDTIWTVTYTQTWTTGKRTVYDKTERFIRLIKRDTTSISGSGIVQIAKQCHDLLSSNGYYYAQAGKNIPFDPNTDSAKFIDCSSYVTCVLYEAGYEDAAGSQMSTHNFSLGAYGLSKGWEVISNPEDLQPGDICFYRGGTAEGPYGSDPQHVNIFVGKDGDNYLCYDCGSPERILAVEPAPYSMSSFGYAFRPNDEIAQSLSGTDIENLKDNISHYLEGINNGTWSVSVRNLDHTSQYESINNRKQESNGWIKLFIMATVYDEVKKGHLEEQDVSSDVERMITRDDNSAADLLVAKIGEVYAMHNTDEEDYFTIGARKVNSYASNHSYNYTHLEKKLSESTDTDQTTVNYTSVKGVTLLLQKIYQGRCVNREYSDKMKEILSHQLIADKIPTTIDNGIVLNKTGESSNQIEDAAIVTIENANYVVAIQGYDLQNKEQAVEQLKKISRIVYTYFSENGSSRNDEVNEVEDEKIDYIVKNARVYYMVSGIGYQCPLGNLKDGSEMLFELLASSEKTQKHEQLMRYLMYLLTNKDYGVTSFNFEEFLGGSFSNVGSLNSYQLFKDWLHDMEGNTGISEDGTMYIVGDDGAGHPTVGYGIDIYNSGFLDRFLQAGYSVNMGDSIPVEFVDALEDEEIQNNINYMKTTLADLNLTDYQIYALVSRGYNCGMQTAVTGVRDGKTFAEAYRAYWDTSHDDEYGVAMNDGMFNHSLYSTYMAKPVTSDGSYLLGLERRRKSEWILFKTGYFDRIDKWCGQGFSDFSGETITAAGYTFPHYLQGDYTRAFGSNTIASAGCGPTSLAMILAGLKGDSSINPVSLVDNLEQYFPDFHAYYTPGSGSNYSGLVDNGFLQQYYQVRSVPVGSNEQAYAALEAGKPILGRENGHVLAIVPPRDQDRNNGYKFYIMDSGRGHDGPYRSAEEAEATAPGFEFLYIIEPSV